jgi:hypothetical protein
VSHKEEYLGASDVRQALRTGIGDGLKQQLQPSEELPLRLALLVKQLTTWADAAEILPAD